MKLLYSPTGLYSLFEGTDAKLTTTNLADFDNLWEEDVFEIFLWTDETEPIYFEYEISSLAAERPISCQLSVVSCHGTNASTF